MRRLLFSMLTGIVFLSAFTQSTVHLVTQTSAHSSAVSSIEISPSKKAVFTSGLEGRIIKWKLSDVGLTYDSEVFYDNAQFAAKGLFALNDETILCIGAASEGFANGLLEVDFKNVSIKNLYEFDESQNPVEIERSGNKVLVIHDNGTVSEFSIGEADNITFTKELELGSSLDLVSVSASGAMWLTSKGEERHKEYQFSADNDRFSLVSESNRHHLQINDIAIAGNGNYVTVADDGKIIRYDSLGKYVSVIAKTSQPLGRVELTEDGLYVLAFEKYAGMGYVFSIDGELINDFRVHDNTVTAAIIFKDSEGDYVTITSGGNQNQLVYWNLLSGSVKNIQKSEGGVIWNLLYNQEEDRLYLSNHTTKDLFTDFVDLNGMVVRNIENQRMEAEKRFTTEFKYVGNYQAKLKGGRVIKNDPEKDGRILIVREIEDKIVVGSDYSLKIISGDEVQTKYFASGGIRSIAFDEKRQYLFTSGDDQTIKIWDWDDLTLDFTLFVDEDSEFILSSKENYFASSQKGSEYFSWIIKDGFEGSYDSYQAAQYFNILYRPEPVKLSYFGKDAVSKILKATGERVFDLTKIDRPSSAIFRSPFKEDGNAKVFIPKEDGVFIVDEGSEIKLDVDVYDGGGGIKELRIYQNSKLVSLDEEFPEGQKSYSREYSVNLVPGNNVFKVSVKNFQEIESNLKQELKVQFNGTVSASSDLYVFTIGINEYDNPAYTLNYADPDARAFLNQIRKTAVGIFDDIHMTYLFNGSAAKDSIERAFEAIAKKATPQDVFIFYYAGHGVMAKNSAGDEEYFLVTPQVTQMYGDAGSLEEYGFSSSRLKQFTAKIKAQKQLVLIDACNSGGAVTAMAARGAAEEKAIFQLARSSGIVLISASGTQQYATEFDDLGHGAFTYVLLEALSGKADTNDDKRITVNELKTFMEEVVPQTTLKYGNKAQYPTGFSSGQDFPIGTVK